MHEIWAFTYQTIEKIKTQSYLEIKGIFFSSLNQIDHTVSHHFLLELYIQNFLSQHACWTVQYYL